MRIGELQGCVRERAPRPAGSCQRLATRLGVERERIDAAIGELAASRAVLDELIAAAGNAR